MIGSRELHTSMETLSDGRVVAFLRTWTSARASLGAPWAKAMYM